MSGDDVDPLSFHTNPAPAFFLNADPISKKNSSSFDVAAKQILIYYFGIDYTKKKDTRISAKAT